MSVAETWQEPDFTSSAKAESRVRIAINDGGAADEQQLLQAARAAGFECRWGHWSDGSGGGAALLFRGRDVERVQLCLHALRAVPEPDGLQTDAVSHEVVVDGSTIRLTAREFALFTYLRARRGSVLSREHLLAHVWGHRYHGGPRTVDTHIGRLRLKFGAALPIETVRNTGYRLNYPSAASAAAAE